MFTVEKVEERLIKEKMKNQTVKFTVNRGILAGKKVIISEDKLNELSKADIKYITKLIETLNDNDYVF